MHYLKWRNTQIVIQKYGDQLEAAKVVEAEETEPMEKEGESNTVEASNDQLSSDDDKEAAESEKEAQETAWSRSCVILV